MGTKENNSKLAYTMLVFLIGIIVLYPTFVGILIKPNSNEWLLLVFIILAIIGIAFSFLGYYLNEFTNSTHDRIVGIGNWTSVIAFLFFVSYFSINLYQDKTQNPSIETITYNPINLSKGENIELIATLDDINNEIEDYKWCSDSTILNIRPDSKIGFLHVPKDYSKDSVKVIFCASSKYLQLKDSIIIYLK